MEKLEKEVDKEKREIIYLKRLDSRDKKPKRDYVPRLEPLMSFRYYGVFV